MKSSPYNRIQEEEPWRLSLIIVFKLKWELCIAFSIELVLNRAEMNRTNHLVNKSLLT